LDSTSPSPSYQVQQQFCDDIQLHLTNATREALTRPLSSHLVLFSAKTNKAVPSLLPLPACLHLNCQSPLPVLMIFGQV
jgi:hypothetical protein